jgi:hypothetical protein
MYGGFDDYLNLSSFLTNSNINNKFNNLATICVLKVFNQALEFIIKILHSNYFEKSARILKAD